MTDNAKIAAFGRTSKDRHGAGCTPFRYPGGKAFLADLLQEHIDRHDGKITGYAEPYAGGAGAAIELLAREAVDHVVLNDFDRRVFCAWSAILNETDRFIDKMLSSDVNLETWYACRDLVVANSVSADPFELGFATYFLNRTNRSGVILGAGPIGGYNQTGRWLINARYYPETMEKRIRWLGSNRDRIRLSNKDGLEFLRSFPTSEAKKTFFFIDPPYVQAGAKLYFNAMNDLKHKDLAAYLTGKCSVPHWLVTYDRCHLVEDAYKGARVESIPVRYSLHRKRNEQELCVLPAA